MDILVFKILTDVCFYMAMFMPLSIEMYLPALPVFSAQFGVPAGTTQMRLRT